MNLSRNEKRLVTTNFSARTSGQPGKVEIQAGDYVVVAKASSNRVAFIGSDNLRYDVNRGTFMASTHSSVGGVK